MNDNDVIKALECCNVPMNKSCKKCLYRYTAKSINSNCNLHKDILDLINRQKAEIEDLNAKFRHSAEMVDILNDACDIKNKEIERLQYVHEKNISSIATLHKKLKTAKAEAVREFAEKIKATFPDRNNPRCTDDDIFTLNSIDGLLEEMEKEGGGE